MKLTDIVSGGDGSELYRIALPDDYLGLAIDEVATRLRNDHHATLLSVNRGGRAFVNPPSDFVLQPGDDAIILADEPARRYRKLVLRDDQIVGAILLGYPAESAGVVAAVQDGRNVSGLLEQLRAGDWSVLESEAMTAAQ